jgi:uncharacterized HAD superfamily protein
MDSLRIALDVEGVLADSHAATAERSDMLDKRHTPPQNYDFGDQDLIDEYMHVSSNVWHNHTHEIPPMQDGLWRSTRTLNRLHNVDILTARVGQDDRVRTWLDGYNVHYDNFISTQHPRSNKTEYGDYDVHIDDSPDVAADVVEAGRYLLLVDRPYNKDIDNSNLVERVSGVSEAADLLSDPSVVSKLSSPSVR